MDITQKFLQIIGRDEFEDSVYEQQQDFFSHYTSQIYAMIQTMLKYMHLQKEKYISKSQIYGHQGNPFTEKERDNFDYEMQSKINLCSEKIKGIQQLLESSINKTEYAHKEIVQGCLIFELNKAILLFKEFKVYRQRQKERVVKLTSLNKASAKQKDINSEKNKQQLKNDDDPLAMENQQLMKKYNNSVKDILNIQSQIRDITQHITQMSEIITRQEMLTEEILGHATESLQSIEKANKHLIGATKLNEQFGARWGLLFFSMGIILLIYDFINS